MGIQINGATDSITAIDGTIDVVSAIGNAGVVTATAFVGNITGNVTGNINHTSNLELQVGGVTRGNFDSSGRLLIGTTTEGHTSGDDLTIATSDTTGITLRGGSSGGGRIFFSDGTSGTAEYEGVVGYDHGTNHLYFSTNHAERLRITSDGDIGIGNNAPDASYGTNLNVHSTGGNTGARIKLSDGTSGTGNVDGFDLLGINGRAYVINRENYEMYFSTNNAVRMRINAGGQVNIGNNITQTSKQFYVDGTAEFTSNITCTNQVYINGTAPQVVFTDTNQDPDYTIKNDGGQLLFIDRTNSNTTRMYANTGGFGGTRLYIADDIVHTGDIDTKIAFTDNQIDLQCAGSSRAYINNYGLYIASGFPLAFLSSSGATPNIKSGGTNAQNLLFTTGTGNPTRLSITSNGKVNIGTGELDQTDRMLNMYGGRARISGITAGNSFEIYASNTSGQSYGILCQAGTNSSDINTALRNTSGVSLFRVRGDGVVFVGSSTVQQGSTSKLEVMGTLNNSYPGYSYPIMVSDDAAYNSSAGPGGGIGFSFKQNSGGAYAQAGGIRGIKENTTDGNYASALTFYTRANGAGTTEKLRIDSSGNVTKPSNFHILVNRNGNQTGYNASNMSDVIIWNRVITGESSTNASNHFNTSTGLFTAPVTGMYLFHVSVNCNYNVQGAWINVNGSRPNYAAFYPNGSMSADAMITYHIVAGETVGTKWYYNGQTNGTINSNNHHTWWRIILLG